MIIVDTNVISEVMRPSPSPQVIAWLNEQDVVTLYLTSITLAEIQYGLFVMPEGKKRQKLKRLFTSYVQTVFADRILDFSAQHGLVYGEIMGKRQMAGNPMSVADGMIAAIARSQEAVLATRNVKDFVHTGVKTVNPFI